MKTYCVIVFAACIGFAQSTPPKSGQKDACTPPPSGVPPSLPARLMTGQGRVHFPITTSNPKAQEFFDQGVAQLHSFWATEAERSFLQAAELDPEAPMPYWGIAMVAAGDYRPRFQLDNYDKVFGKGNPLKAGARAIAAAKKADELAEVPGKASDLEKMYVAAIVARRLPDANHPDVNHAEEAYVRALRAIVATHPDEIEARTYLALHLMRGFELPDKKPRGTSMEAVEILRDLLNRAPDHPGVHHYVIHGFEGSRFAKDAWPSCQRYSELVTNIPHALHMPGHIYSQTGRWDDAVRSFEAAAENERGYIKADSLYGFGHHGHNVHYLATAYSFEGQYDKAKSAARELLALKENPREQANLDGFFSGYRQGWFAMLRTLVQSESWDEILDGTTLPAYAKPREEAWRHWAMALAHIGKGERELAKQESGLMDASLLDYKEKVKMPIPEPLKVARVELDGQLQVAAGKLGRGMHKLRDAARLELEMVYSEPPYYPRPVSEALGEIAMQHRRPADAQAAFRIALDQYPNSYKAQK
ncbi:MAG: tetratricopeptide repeat protein [Acidobacteriota bacterium]|nr:tetratricopeptide repeat protein [Acidobacteriota bacterium]